ncbi:MAG: helix-turn-helix transcriptional regulator [Pseudomonadota bacterium]
MNEIFADRASPVTSRERDVLGLLARGCTYSRIAERLGISPHTVSSHIKSVYRKLGVRCAAAAVMRAVELRLLAGDFDRAGGT